MHVLVALFLFSTNMLDAPAPPPPAAPVRGTVLGDAGIRERAAERARERAIAAALREVAGDRRRRSPRTAAALRTLGYAYEVDRYLGHAIGAYFDAAQLDKRQGRSVDVATDLFFEARIGVRTHRYAAARDAFYEALARVQHPGDVQGILANAIRRDLARVLVLEGRFSDAEDLIRRAQRFDNEYRPWDSLSRGQDLAVLGDLDLARQHYAEALADYDRSVGLETRVAGIAQAAYTFDAAPGLTRSLAGLDADPASQTVMELGDELLKANDDLIALKTGKLTSPYQDDVSVAEFDNTSNPVPSEIDQLREIIGRQREIDRFYGGAGVTIAQAYTVLGNLRFAARDDAGAQSAYAEARRAYVRALGARCPQLGELDAFLGRSALRQGRERVAIALLRRAVREEASFGLSAGPVAQMATGLLARADDADGRVAAAGTAYARALGLMRALLTRSGSFLTERQRLSYLKTVHGTVDAYGAFLISRRPHGSAGALFDLALFGKELVAGSITSVYAASASDPRLQRLRARLEAARRKTYQGNDFKAGAIADIAEADLVAAAASRKLPASPVTHWQDVRAVLAPHEAAVEYLRAGDTYVALVLRARSTEPQCVPIGSAAAVAAAIAPYASAVTPGGDGAPEATRPLYALAWSPLAASLAGVTRVYLAADGALDQVAFSILEGPDGHYLIDLVDLRQMSSTKDLLARSQPSAPAKTAAVFADPAFDARVADDAPLPPPDSLAGVLGAPPTNLVAVTPDLDETRIAIRGGSLVPLPETETELHDVVQMLHDRGWSVDAFHGVDATKPELEAVRHPRLLHVATHGYVLRDVPNAREEVYDPLKRSMLFFAGGGRTWSKLDPPGSPLDNGVLTADEVSALDLHGTELVVLSACETGLGRIEAGEGVLGLRRAFQQAGAQFVLSTLWQIPSDETVELLDLFYRKWLGGENKYDALRDAQRTLRERLIARTGRDDPRAWGAFVLVGNGRG